MNRGVTRATLAVVSVSLITVLIAVLVGITIIRCDSEPASQTEDKKAQPLGAEREQSREIIFAVHPYASPVALAEQFAPLIEFLSERTGLSFSLIISKNYENHISLVGNDQVDIAFMGPVSYVTMADRFGQKQLLCRFEINGEPYFQGYIIARQDNPATSLGDLQGHSFGSSSRVSTMSYVVPRYMFIQAGIPFPEAHLRIVGSHNNVCLNVLAGDINAGAIREKTYQKYKDREIKVITVTPKIAEHPFVATDRLDSETVDLIREALLSIKSENDVRRLLTPIKATLTRLVPVADEDYDELRVILSTVREDEKRLAGHEGNSK